MHKNKQSYMVKKINILRGHILDLDKVIIHITQSERIFKIAGLAGRFS